MLLLTAKPVGFAVSDALMTVLFDLWAHATNQSARFFADFSKNLALEQSKNRQTA